MNEQTPPAQLAAWLRAKRNHELAEGWWHWANAAEAHKILSRQFLDQLADYPASKFAGRGIVICAGGSRLFANGWVCLRMLRRLGCALPVQFWHLQDEIDSFMAGLARPYGAECVDAHAVAGAIERPPRYLGGWELKAFALLHSSFKEALLLDADNVPVVNPEFLFETPEFRSTGAIFWPDFERLEPTRSIWNVAEAPYRDEPEVESGQIVLDKSRCWPALNLAMHYNEHSDFYYHHIHGDKCTFQFAWRRTATEYSMPGRGIEALEATMCQHDFEGRRIFQHRNMDKWRLDGSNQRIAGFQFEAECRRYLLELANQWNGQPFATPEASPAARELQRVLAGQRFIYHRVGYDRREIALVENGRIGRGAAGCERRWCVEMRGDHPLLVIAGDEGVTCRLTLDDDGAFRGQWARHERMPIELLPLVDSRAS